MSIDFDIPVVDFVTNLANNLSNISTP